MPARHEVRRADVNEKRLGAVLALAHERDLRDFASFLLLEQLGPAHAAVAGAGCGSRARRTDTIRRPGPFLLRARRQGRPPISGAAEGLRRVDRGAAARARCRQAWAYRQARGLRPARRVHAGDRGARQPEADVESTIAHERAISRVHRRAHRLRRSRQSPARQPRRERGSWGSSTHRRGRTNKRRPIAIQSCFARRGHSGRSAARFEPRSTHDRHDQRRGRDEQRGECDQRR